MTRILPSYDEAQERLEELRERLKYAEEDVAVAGEALATWRSIYDSRSDAAHKARKALFAHLEKMVVEAAAEKAVRG